MLNDGLRCSRIGVQTTTVTKLVHLMKRNRVIRISLSGGLIGLLTTNPRKALDDAIDKANMEGWNAIHITEHATHNLLIKLLQVLVLVITIGLWTWGAGYIVLLEREHR